MNKYFFLILLFICEQAHTQTNFGQTWVNGLKGYNIKFQNPILHDTIFNLPLGFFRGHSNICDSNGNLLFACDGMNIYDKNWNLMQDGDTLVPKAWADFNQNFSRYTESSIILPFENKKYYIVTPAMNDTQLTKSQTNPPAPLYAPLNLLLYHVVDMNANAGLGKVTQRMLPILENKELSKTQMMACRHANGKDWWLLKMAGDTNVVYKFLFTQDSVYNKGTQTIPFTWRGYWDIQGQMVFSRDGSKWATTYTNFFGEAYIGDFDRCTGLLSNFTSLTVPPQLSGYSLPVNVMDTNNTGLCFSPSGNMLYIARTTHVLQYNLTTQTYYKVCGWDTTADGFAGYTSLMLAPDNKIYLGHKGGTSKQMSVIDNPDIANIGCNFCRKCLRSKSNWGVLSAPPCMPNYELGASGQPCWPLSISNPTNEGDEILEVYPNPSNDKIKVESRKYKDAIKQLYNSIGQLMLSTKENEIDVSNLSSGIYYIRCGNSVKKVMIE